jgi:hypothetical protein
MMALIRQGVVLKKTIRGSPSPSGTSTSGGPDNLNDQLEAALSRINKQCASFDEDDDNDEEQDFGE